MKAISLISSTAKVELIEKEEPQIQLRDQVKLKVLEVGVCGTDRELVSEGKAVTPVGENNLILGHEMLGVVTEVGADVKTFKPGDHAVVVVRRSCGRCNACLKGRSDMCYSDGYLERGIKGQHGFHAEYVVDQEQFLIKVPDDILSCGVLCEPMSVVQKALEEMIAIQRARLPDWSTREDLSEKRVLVVGLGSIGLLAAIALRLRGFKVYGQDIVDPNSKRVKILEAIGGVYVDGSIGTVDLIVEAVGNAKLDFDLFQSLGANGGYVIAGIPKHESVFSIEGGHLIRELVLKNQVILGCVNADAKHWQLAIQDLVQAQSKWPGVVEQLITARVAKERFKELISMASGEEIKCVLVW